MAFIALVAIVAFTVAAAAAYFSVYGLALIFSGAIIPVVIMASALEVGKLCATSILYNYWHRLGILMRLYYLSAIFVLMLITSGGIYGFLSAAYQQDKMPLEQVNQRIELLDAEYARKVDRLKQMDDTIASIGANYITKRLEEKEQQRPEREALSARINEIESEKLKLSQSKIETEAHIGPVIYMAQVFNKTPDQATNFLIMLFIFVFDPLAVALTISVNMLVSARKEQLGEQPNPDPDPDKVQPSDLEERNKAEPHALAEDYTDVDVLSEVLELSDKPIETKSDGAPEPVTDRVPKFTLSSMQSTINDEGQVQPIKDETDRDLDRDVKIVNEALSTYTAQLKTSLDELVNKQPEQQLTVDDVRQTFKESIGDLVDSLQQPTQPTPEQPLASPVIDQETHDRVDAKLERRRQLVKQVRGNNLS